MEKITKQQAKRIIQTKIKDLKQAFMLQEILWYLGLRKYEVEDDN